MIMRGKSLILDLESLFEAFYLSCGVNNPLLASEERMTGGTDIRLYALLRGTRRPGVAAGTNHRCLTVVLGMDTLLHDNNSDPFGRMVSTGERPALDIR